MIDYEHSILIILIVIVILILLFYRKPTKVYYFIDKNDKRGLKTLKKILKKTNVQVIIVKTNKKKDKYVQKLIEQLNGIRPVKKVLNIENFSDMVEIAFESCFRNAKCVNQPSDKFYAIVNKFNVFGYPFDFDSNLNNLISPSDIKSDNGLAAITSNDDKTKNINVPSCGRKRSLT